MDDSNKPEQLSSLDKFKRRLERRDGDQSSFKSTLLPPKDFKVSNDWAEDQFTAVDHGPAIAKRTNTFLWRLFWGSSFFFLVTVAIAIYALFFSTNVISGNNIDLLVKGPAQIRSGDELNLQTTIVNKNKAILNSVNLVFSYPSGTMDPLSPNQELPIWREKLNDLNPGQTIDVASRAVVFGGQNTTREIKIVLEYRIPDSNALFTKEKIYTVTIGSSSLDLALKMPTETNIGKEFTGTLRVVSNAQSLLRNCTIRFEWPEGFVFKTADPAPSESDNAWFLGDLVPGMEKEINFTGTLSGQSGDVKPFKVLAGLASNGGKDQMTLEYGNLFQTINLRKDFVSADIFLVDKNGNNPIVFPGGILSGYVSWFNNLDDKIVDGSFNLRLQGDLIDKRTVQASSGFYNSIDNTISWDERILPSLKEIFPNGEGQTNFKFDLSPLLGSVNSKSQEINLKLTFRGTRVIGENQTEEVVTQSEKTVKISTLAKFVANGVYHTGPFKNTGPLPPKVGQETTYTINWVVTNTINDLGDVVVRTILPPATKWLSLVSPLDEKVVYNQTNGEVVWNLGKVAAGTGDSSPARQVSFQISLLPSLSHVGKAFDLTGRTTFDGKDLYTGAVISQETPPVSTMLLTDPNFVIGQEIVTE
ncbi:MAG: hypothetical protein WC640_01105 [Candidatus Paceibacterota bacterium]|jgi:hypothetical protein